MVEFASGQEICSDVNEQQIDKFFTLKYEAKLCAPGSCVVSWQKFCNFPSPDDFNYKRLCVSVLCYRAYKQSTVLNIIISTINPRRRQGALHIQSSCQAKHPGRQDRKRKKNQLLIPLWSSNFLRNGSLWGREFTWRNWFV